MPHQVPFRVRVFSSLPLQVDTSTCIPRAAKEKPDTTPHYNVGDRVTVTRHIVQLVGDTIRAIIESTDGTRYQVDYGKDQTALVESWRPHIRKNT